MNKDLEKAILQVKRMIETNTSNEMIPLLEAYKDSLERLQGKATQLTSKHIEEGEFILNDAESYVIAYQLEQEIIKEAQEIGNLELSIIAGALIGAFENSYYRTFYHVERGISVGINFNLLRPEFVNQAINMPLNGARFSDRIWKNKEGMIRRLRGVIQRTIIDGTDPKKMIKGMSDAFGSSAYESTRLVQNEVARVTTRASQEVYHSSGVVEKILFNATLDDVTSKICRGLDGEVFDLGTEPQIPDDTHIGCRSVLIPMIKGWNPTRRKDNITKEIIDYTTYDKWAKSRGIN